MFIYIKGFKEGTGDGETSKKKQKNTKKNKEQKEEVGGQKNQVEGMKGDDVSDSFFSGERFDVLPLSDKMRNGLSGLGFERMAHIQSQSIPPLLSGKDLLGQGRKKKCNFASCLTLEKLSALIRLSYVPSCSKNGLWKNAGLSCTCARNASPS